MTGNANPLSIRVPGGTELQTSASLVSIGSSAKNQVALDDTTVSRRHALIANFPDDVWLYDLGSTRGTQVDGNAVAGRAFLDGVHRVRIGRLEIEVTAHAGLLV